MRTFSINRNQLKYIAIVSMTLDHIGAAFVNILFLNTSITYILLRSIGRLAFPIFAFLLVEGFFFTRSKKKYIARLIIFAFIAELPFDFGIMINNPLSFKWTALIEHQNTLFTLALGMILMTLLDTYREKFPIESPIALLTCFAFLLLAEALNTDYGMFGVFFIISLYYRKNLFALSRPYLSLFICFLPLMATGGRESLCVLSFFLLMFYDPGYCKGNKYFFYIYYPLHLSILACIKLYLVS